MQFQEILLANFCSRLFLEFGRYGKNRNRACIQSLANPVYTRSMSSNLIALEDLGGVKKPNTCLMGLDLGSKTIGIAVSDTRLVVASPRETLARKKFSLDAQYLVQMVEKEIVFAFIVGMPLNMDGSEGRRAQSTRSFIRNMAPLTKIPFVLWDESLSSFAADQAMIEADLSRRKRAEKIDAIAAAIILQGALDRIQAEQLL